MNFTNKDLKKRILDISYKYKLSHLGSCLTAVDIIDEIYNQMFIKPGRFILSSGHAGLALYVVLEKYSKLQRTFDKELDAEKIFDHHGVHPDRCKDCSIDCSTGSLGNGLPIAVGMALADRSKNVYCLISDGECAEGSIYEAINIIQEQHIQNLQIYCNANQWAAYRKTNVYDHIAENVNMRTTYNMDGWPSFLQGQEAHYHIMTQDEYKEALECLK